MIKDEIIIALQQVTGSEDIKLDMPSNKDHGDYATSVAITLAKRQKKNPLELARELVSKLENDSELRRVVSKIEVADPGFINFFLKDEVLAGYVNQINTDPVGALRATPNKKGRNALRPYNKRAVVEYSSPNIAKPFGIGHFRSTIIGDAVANLLEATGWTVYRDNHLGDWGTQFGKLIYKLKSVNRENLTIKDLVDLYVEFHKEAEQDPTLEDKAREEFKKLEEGEPENRKIWQFCVDV